MLSYLPFSMNLFNNALKTKKISCSKYPINPFILAASAHWIVIFDTTFPNYFVQQSQQIILKLLHYDTSQSCSIFMTQMQKKQKLKLKLSKIQKATNVSPRKKVLLSMLIINAKTREKKFRPNHKNIIKSWYLKQIKLSC